MFYKNHKNYKIPTYITCIYGCIFGILGIYYISIGNSQRTAIIDAPLFLLMENINRYIIPHFNLLVCIGSAVFLMIIYLLRKEGRIENVLGGFIQFNKGGILIFFLINLIQLPLYTNIIARGKVIEDDAIKIAHFCENNEPDNIYMIGIGLEYERATNAYLKRDIIYLEDIDKIDTQNSIIICKKGYELSLGTEEYELGTQNIQVYKLE